MTNRFPREIAKGIFWFGNCLRIEAGGEVLHSHLSCYLLAGEKTLLVDTGMPQSWASMSLQLTEALAGRQLDYVFPTHPEAPHCSNLPRILAAYPAAKIVGDVRDYALYYPEFSGRLLALQEGEEIDLGGKRLIFVPAVLKDLPSTLWAYEPTHKVLFTADGFCFLHAGSQQPLLDEPLHRPGECTLTSAELIKGVDLAKTEFFVKAALYWSRYVDPDILFAEVAELLAAYPTEIIAPAHGNVIVDVPKVLPVMKQTHMNTYVQTTGLP